MRKPLQLHNLHKISRLPMLMLMEQTNLFHLRILLAILLLPLRIPATPSEVDHHSISDDQTTLLNWRGKMMNRDNVLFKNWTADPSPGVCSWMRVSCTSNPNKRVQGLYLSGMGLQGTIPPELGRLSDLVLLNLSNNSLEGDFPVEICDLSSLKFLDLSKNNLSGGIPEEVEQLQDLIHLSLANNQFNGSIPENISHLENLKFLDLSSNELSGEFPGKQLSHLNLTYLNVSHNKLKGKVPCGGNFSKFRDREDAFEPNDHLDCHCPPLYNARRTSLFVCVFMGIAIGLLALGFAFVELKRVQATVDFYEQLHQATNGFHENNKLEPEGRFGSVYKGRLSRPKDEEEAAQKENVAVKVFKLEEIELKNFDAESKRLRGLGSHRNLTPVIGSCSLTSLAMVMGRRTYSEFKALVMKFMPQGSLEGCLHSGKCSLDINRRLQIMIGVASGLEYLHERGLLHGDLKPSNVLLDEDMVAHLSDFGITKSEKTKKQDMQQPPSDVEQDDGPKKLHPTVYSDPEYWPKTSAKSDVYSFGIMLMETFTGKKPTDGMFGEELSLRDWVKEALDSSTVHQVVDAGLIREEEFKAKVVECVTSILKLAVECSEELAADRMDIKDVVDKLKTIPDV